MVDHATRLSVVVVIPSKKRTHTFSAVMKYWVALYDMVETFLTDNGGEFIHDELITLCKILNINWWEIYNIDLTDGRSPWSNGIVEKHNLVLSEWSISFLEENRCSLDLAHGI